MSKEAKVYADPRFVRDDFEYGVVFEIRCPDCQTQVILTQVESTCSCPRTWILSISAVGQLKA